MCLFISPTESFQLSYMSGGLEVDSHLFKFDIVNCTQTFELLIKADVYFSFYHVNRVKVLFLLEFFFLERIHCIVG